MRVRPFLAVAAAAALVATMPAHAKGPSYKVLDGKKIKTLSFSDKITTPQDNDKDAASTSSSDRSFCSAPRCSRFTFIYKPAKGVRSGAFSAKITWSYPAEDYDLYIAQDNIGDVGHCGAGAGTSEVVVISNPLPGHRYTVVIDHYRAIPDTVTATVSFPAKDKVATTAPAAAEKFEAVNCGIS
jgi:hypothetical protein